MPSRRVFLAAAAAGIATVATWRYQRGSEEDAVIAVLQKRLGYLKLDAQGLRAFARDLVGARIVSAGRLRLIAAAAPVYSRLDLSSYPRVLTHTLRHGEERLVSLYLLSSDFFPNGADETRIVRYRAYYDPVRDPHLCRNPFARPVVF